MRQRPSSAERLKFAKRVVIAGAIAMIAMGALFVYSDFHPLFTPDEANRRFGSALVLASALGALIVLTGYILVSWDLPPVKAMLFGAGSIAAGFVTPFIVWPVLFAISAIGPSFLNTRGGVMMVAGVFFGFFGTFIGSGIVAFLVGLIRFWHKSPPKP